MSKQKRFTSESVIYYATAVLIPIIIMLITFKKLSIAPFGRNDLLSMDLWGQYFPMLTDQARTFINDTFSFTGGLGFNQLGQSGYYTNSLFNIFYKPFEGIGLINAIDYMILIKFGLSSLTCAVYLKKHFKSTSVFLVAASVAYSLCTYNLAFMSQIMWTDTVILFPLIILGVERLIDENKPFLYCITLAVAIYSNFYIGFAVCIFVALYFLAYIIKNENKYNLRQNGEVLLRFAGFSILAAALCAFSIIPTYEAVSSTASAAAQFPTEIKAYHSFAEYIYSLFPYTKLSYEYGVPNIGAGAFVLILVPLYFFNKQIKTKNKVVNGAFLIFLYFSMNLNVLDFMWHGFHFPNQLPGRWTFMFIFLVIKMAVEGLQKRDGVKASSVLMSFGLSMVAVQFAKYALNEGQILNENISSKFSSVTVKLIIYAVVLLVFSLDTEKIMSRLGKSKAPVVTAPAVEIAVEPVAEPEVENEEVAVENAEADDVAIDKAEDLTLEDIVAESIVIEATEDEGVDAEIAEDDSVEAEFAPENTWVIEPAVSAKSRKKFCIGKFLPLAVAVVMLFDIGFNAVTTCSDNEGGTRTSDIDSYVAVIDTLQPAVDKYACPENDFYRSEANSGWTFNSGELWGYNGMGFYSSVFNADTYHFLHDIGNGHYAENISIVYNNKSPVMNSFFGLKYMFDRDRNYKNPGMNRIETAERYDVYENSYALPLAFAVSGNMESWTHNDFTNALTQQNEFVNAAYGSNINVYEKTVRPMPESNCYRYNILAEGEYFFEHRCTTGMLKCRINGANEREIDKGYERFAYLGELHTGDTVEIYTQGCQIEEAGIELYSFNTAKFESVVQKLKSQSMTIEQASNTKITGSINLNEDSLVYTSIPQDGWTAYCDGEQVETVSIGDALLGVKVPKGTHELKFTYSAPGFTAGLVISGLYLLIFVLVVLMRKKNIKLRSFFVRKH